MCRWFAYLAPDEECLLEDVLITPAHGLSKQVHDHYLPMLLSHDPNGPQTNQVEISRRNRLNNVDGFGVAWYTTSREVFNESRGPRPALYKHAQPPTNDANFHCICANTSSTAVMAHIRAATTVGAVTPSNSHPFVFGRHTVMHNGVVTNFMDIKRDMLNLLEKDAYENIHGSTDSEHLAALYMTFLTKHAGRPSWEQKYSVSEMKGALTSALKTIIELQQKILGKDKAEANSVNVCVGDGEQMVAIRFRNHEVEQPPSLYWSNTAGKIM